MKMLDEPVLRRFEIKQPFLCAVATFRRTYQTQAFLIPSEGLMFYLLFLQFCLILFESNANICRHGFSKYCTYQARNLFFLLHDCPSYKFKFSVSQLTPIAVFYFIFRIVQCSSNCWYKYSPLRHC